MFVFISNIEIFEISLHLGENTVQILVKHIFLRIIEDIASEEDIVVNNRFYLMISPKISINLLQSGIINFK